MPRRWQRSPRALSFLEAVLSPPGRQWEARPAGSGGRRRRTSLGSGRSPERPVTSDEILSKARSRVSKLEAAIQILDGEDPALEGLQKRKHLLSQTRLR